MTTRQLSRKTGYGQGWDSSSKQRMSSWRRRVRIHDLFQLFLGCSWWILGTSNFGILDVPFPEGSVFVSQILWGSIGWAVGQWLIDPKLLFCLINRRKHPGRCTCCERHGTRAYDPLCWWWKSVSSFGPFVDFLFGRLTDGFLNIYKIQAIDRAGDLEHDSMGHEADHLRFE